MCKRQYQKNGGQKIKESKDRHSDSIFVDKTRNALTLTRRIWTFARNVPVTYLTQRGRDRESIYIKSLFVFANSPDGGLGRSLSCFWVWWLLSALFSIAKILLLLFPRVIRPMLSCTYTWAYVGSPSENSCHPALFLSLTNHSFGFTMAHREFSHKQNEIQRRKKKELEKVPRKRNLTPAFRLQHLHRVIQFFPFPRKRLHTHSTTNWEFPYITARWL
jgi:hypothetical protein